MSKRKSSSTNEEDQDKEEREETVEGINETYQTKSGRIIRKPERHIAYETILEPYDYEEEDK